MRSRPERRRRQGRSRIPRIPRVLGALAVAGGLLGAAGEPAQAQARLDYRTPVVGSPLELILEDATPFGSYVFVARAGDGMRTPLGQASADATGTAKLMVAELPVAAAGASFEFMAVALDQLAPLDAAAPAAVVAIEIEAPSLLLTGREGGEAVLYRVPLDLAAGAATPFDLAGLERRSLGFGEPGAAVRDVRCERTFVIADAARGRLLALEDDPRLPAARLDLEPGLRGIAVTPDGRSVLIVSAGDPAAGEAARLHVVEARPPFARSVVDLGFPLGAGGGRVVVSSDGLRAFVTLDGAFLRDVDLIAGRPGSKLLAVGAPGQDEIRDLRVIAGSLVALTGRADNRFAPSAITGFDIAYPKRGGSHRAAAQDDSLRFAQRSGDSSLFLLDGADGSVAVIDVATFRTRGAFAVPKGADALLLAPDPASTFGALLYGADEPGSEIRSVDLANQRVGDAEALGFAASAASVMGSSSAVDLLFVADDAGRLVALRPRTLERFVLPVPLAWTALSVGP
jgi:hypothetical protein